MDSKSILLLKTLLLSTSPRNIYAHTTDKKKRRKIVFGYIGTAILYAMLVAYSLITCVGLGFAGTIDVAPALCALTISALSFVFTLFKTNGYLFNFKEYDMLMSLPFEARTVASSKYLYMYLKSLPWYLCVSMAVMLGYAIIADPGIWAYPLWILLTFFLPVIPMLAATFLGFLIAKVSSRFKKTNLIQTVLTFVFIAFSFSFRFIVEGLFRDDKMQEALAKASEATDQAAHIYAPAGWFADAITKGNVLSALLLVSVSGLLFAAVFHLLGNSYQRINSALKSRAASRNFEMSEQRRHSVVNAIAFKEFKRFTSSTIYMTNAGMGEVFAVLLGVVTLVIGFDRILDIVTREAPFDHSILQPAIPFIAYFFIGMVATTACSPSLEGKNYWIIQSLPLSMKSVYQGKMLFNLYLTVPFMTFSVLCMCVSLRVPVLDTILSLVLGVALCAFSTTWGCVCGVKHIRLDWENEVEVIKQGTAVTIYLLPNMLVTMGLTALVIFLGQHVNHGLIALGFTLIASVLALLSYRRVLSLCKA